MMVTFLPFQGQRDGHNCAGFAVAFAAKIFGGKSPIGAVFHVHRLLSRRIYCLGGKVGGGGDSGALVPWGMRRGAPVGLMTKTKKLQLLDWHHCINLLF